LTAANLPNVKLEGADLTGAICVNAIFNQVDLRSIKYEGATFQGASFLNAKLPLGLLRQNCRGVKFLENDLSTADLSGGDFSECSFDKVRLPGAQLQKATLRSARFYTCDLQGADLSGVDGEGARFDHSNLTRAKLRNARLTGADFTGAELARADISHADFYEANLAGARTEQIEGAPRARNLASTRIAGGQVQYFDSAVLSHWDRLDWEKVRIAGRLPLFGASYSVLIAIPLFFYALEIYNDKVELIRGWAKRELSGAGTTDYHMAQMVLQRLHPLPPPALSELLLVSTLLLASGASIYAIACPSRVKEFSRDQWKYQLGLSEVHYMAAAWSGKPWRLAALAFYILGGFGAAIVLGSKLVNVAMFIVSNQTWSL
jgi:uncharacterized protein YjbI with pentapeptide repeats